MDWVDWIDVLAHLDIRWFAEMFQGVCEIIKLIDCEKSPFPTISMHVYLERPGICHAHDPDPQYHDA